MYNIMELKDAKKPTGNNVLIVDALNLAFRYKHSGKQDFAEDYVTTIKSLAKSYNAKDIIITTDFGSSTYRLEIYPEYKADRRAKVANQTEEEALEFELFIKEFNRTVDRLQEEFTVLRYKGVEADDLAAYLTHYVLKNYDGEIWLISSDKDWDLLITDKVSRFSYVTRKEYTMENWEDNHEFPHEYSLDIKVLQGGKDNIPGIPGVGPKRALQLVQQYGSALDIYDQIPLKGNQVFIKNTNAFKDNILRNIELIDKITYCTEAIGIDNCKDIDKKMEGLKC